MRIAFLANSFHLKRTGSCLFLIDCLRQANHSVEVIPHSEAWVMLPSRKYDTLIVFQHLYSPEELEAFGVKRVVLVPMYDDCPKDVNFWKRYGNFKALCFSFELLELLRGSGLDAWGCHYYPPGAEAVVKDRGGPPHGFFWPRVRGVSWATIKTLIAAASFDRFHLHWTPELMDGLEGAPSEEDFRKYKIEVSSWFADRADYRRSVCAANVFFAPRRLEGIGMSFLEAMTWGLCVVAPNRPTMREYIEDGRNGLLYDDANPRPLDFSRLHLLGEKGRLSCISGRRKWEESLPVMERFLSDSRPGVSFSKHRALVLRKRSYVYLRAVYRLVKRLTARERP